MDVVPPQWIYSIGAEEVTSPQLVYSIDAKEVTRVIRGGAKVLPEEGPRYYQEMGTNVGANKEELGMMQITMSMLMWRRQEHRR